VLRGGRGLSALRGSRLVLRLLSLLLGFRSIWLWLVHMLRLALLRCGLRLGLLGLWFRLLGMFGSLWARLLRLCLALRLLLFTRLFMLRVALGAAKQQKHSGWPDYFIEFHNVFLSASRLQTSGKIPVCVGLIQSARPLVGLFLSFSFGDAVAFLNAPD
jgi:hypothetical protein